MSTEARHDGRTESRARVVARDDVAHARRSRLLWGAFALIALLVVPTFWSTVGNLRAIEGEPAPVVQAVSAVPSHLATYLFVLVVALAYGAVVAERESGAVRFVLGSGGTRRDLLVGKLLARVGLLVAVLAPLLVLLGVMIRLRQGGLPLVAYAAVCGWVLAYGALWTTFTVGLSAAFRSQYRALAAIAGTYVVFAWNAPIWKAMLEPLLSSLLPAGADRYVASLNPTRSLFVVSDWLLARTTAATTDGGVGPVVVSAGTLLALAGAGLLVGARRFGTADLG